MDTPRFSDPKELIESYSDRYIHSNEDSYLPILVAEAKKRIRYLWRIHIISWQKYLELKSLHPKFNELTETEANKPPDFMIRWLYLSDCLEMYAESFYFIAWRLREVIRQLPGLKSFEANGVLMVRNHLIEHPEKHGHKSLWGFIIDYDKGPILARAVPKGEEMIDAGLWHNSREFTDQLRNTLKNAIKRNQHRGA